jgi:serine/threonine protein kinase
MIIELLGYPEEDELEILADFKDKEMLKKIKRFEGETFEAKFAHCSPEAVDLLKRMLTFDPSKRITVEDSLSHPYLSALHFPDDEPTTEPVCAFDFDFEIYDLDRDDYKELLYEEAMLYHSDVDL